MLSINALLNLNARGFDQGLRVATGTAHGFARNLESTFGRLGNVFSAAGVLGGLHKLDKMFDKLNERVSEIKLGSAQSGFDPDTFQRFDNVLKATGQSSDKAFNSLEKLAEVTEKIKSGDDAGGKLAASMAAFGVTMEDIKKKDYRQIFFQISDAMKVMVVDAKSLGALSDLLGGKAGDLVPAMKLGFQGKAANKGILSEKDIKDLDLLKKVSQESDSFWGGIATNAAKFFGTITTGLKAVPSTLIGIARDNVSIPGGPDGSAGMQQRLLTSQRAKAERANAQSKRAEQEKAADEIRAKFAARKSDVDEQIAAERFSLLTNEEKLHVLKAQADVLREMRGNVNADIRSNGDPTGEKALKLSEIQLARLKNREQQSALSKQPDPQPSQRYRYAGQINSLQAVGAFVSSPSSTSIQSEMRRLETALRENTRAQQQRPQQIPSGFSETGF